LVPEVDGAQIGAISGGAFSIEVMFRWYQIWRRNIQVLGCVSKDKHPLTQQHLHQYSFQANPMKRAM
jgi:hypothetical protein